MKDESHQLRRRRTCWSSSSKDTPIEGFASNSASRRRASAIPSSSSCNTDGSDPSRCAARIALWLSGKFSASLSISAIVAITERYNVRRLENKRINPTAAPKFSGVKSTRIDFRPLSWFCYLLSASIVSILPRSISALWFVFLFVFVRVHSCPFAVAFVSWFEIR
jgi:hypothetical protein